jgi:phosphoribosylformimino-5-aminoimidazole carboxamide ribotide isomerase
VQVGGGLRDLAAVEAVLASRARWAVLGTRAVVDSVFLKAVCAAHGPRIIVAVDGRGQRVAVKGWTETLDETVNGVGKRAADAGAAALLFTDVSRDGTELGPNIEDTAALATAVGVPVLASGGVGKLEHLERLARVPGVAGVVVGRALYTAAVELKQALAVVGSRAGLQ